MAEQIGALIVLEGIDGSGKSTQYALLRKKLDASGTGCCGTSFPNYESLSGKLVSAYLGGAYGSRPEDVNAYAASSFYAIDRYASFMTEDWGRWWRSGGLVVSARYTTSNAIHQGAKLPPAERKAFFAWLAEYEYGKLRIPEPDAVYLLEIEPETALSLIRAREAATGVARDIHEQDERYLYTCAQTADAAADFFGWKRIPVSRNGAMRSVTEISQALSADVFSLKCVEERHY